MELKAWHFVVYQYEREFLASKSRDLNMLFESFVEIYLNDLKPRIKYNTYLTKVHIIETKIIPYFAKKSIAEITAPDILLLVVKTYVTL